MDTKTASSNDRSGSGAKQMSTEDSIEQNTCSSRSSNEVTSSEDNSRKRKKLSGEERLNRNRERNRIHARKTRERKRHQSMAVQQKINDLYDEGMMLRQLVDERYTASSLLGLSNCMSILKDENQFVPSNSICHNYFEEVLKENSWLRDSSGQLILNDSSTQAIKRVRRSGKYSPQERDHVRRERNRMHAKRTRDRKKHFFELSDKIISEMEAEVKKLRDYLISLNIPIPKDRQEDNPKVKLESCLSDGSDETESEAEEEDPSVDIDEEGDDDIEEDADCDMENTNREVNSLELKTDN